MQPTLEHITVGKSSLCCFPTIVHEISFFWHVHAAYELTIIRGGTGQRFVGDSIEEYDDDELVLLGPNIPHAWTGSSGTQSPFDIYCVQCTEDWYTKHLATLPECRDITHLFARSQRGLVFSSEMAARIRPLLTDMQTGDHFYQLVRFLEILHILAADTQARQLLPQYYHAPEHVTSKQNLINEICAHIIEHHHKRLDQKTIAAYFHMSTSSFSHFFKRHLGCTFIDHLRNLRIASACTLLSDTTIPITNICHRVGFRSQTNFNRCFTIKKGCTPRQFRKNYIEAAQQ